MIPLWDRWQSPGVKAEAMGTEKASQVIKVDDRFCHHPGEENLDFPNIMAAIKTVSRGLQPRADCIWQESPIL